MFIIKIPEFKTDEEIAKFWDNNSFEDYFEDVTPGEIEFFRQKTSGKEINEIKKDK